MEPHVVICSSVGGTDPDHIQNRIGRVTSTTKTGKEEEDGTTSSTDTTTTGGNILRWKRKAEMYLSDSGLPYTIVHPGGLLNEAGGKRELVVGVDDVTEGTGSDNRSIPREDVVSFLFVVGVGGCRGGRVLIESSSSERRGSRGDGRHLPPLPQSTFLPLSLTM